MNFDTNFNLLHVPLNLSEPQILRHTEALLSTILGRMCHHVPSCAIMCHHVPSCANAARISPQVNQTGRTRSSFFLGSNALKNPGGIEDFVEFESK